MRTKFDLIGQRFGKLTVVELMPGRGPCQGTLRKCQCDCGGIAYVETGHLRSGKRVSCGCAATRAAIKPNYPAKTDCPHYREEITLGCKILTVKMCEKKGRCGFYDQAKREGK